MGRAKIIKRHDVDSAVKILLKNAGPGFKEQVVKWGAVHAESRRCAPYHLRVFALNLLGKSRGLPHQSSGHSGFRLWPNVGSVTA